MSHRADWLGKRVGDLNVVALHGTTPNGQLLWLCVCLCGKDCLYSSGFLTSRAASDAKTVGCPKCRGKRQARSIMKHGGASEHFPNQKKLRAIWHGMVQRCTIDKHKHRNYFGRGIKVCDEWRDWPTFREWALANGYEPGLSIDRLDSWRNYEPSNCRWVTRSLNSSRASQKEMARRKREAAPRSPNFPPSYPVEMFWGAT